MNTLKRGDKIKNNKSGNGFIVLDVYTSPSPEYNWNPTLTLWIKRLGKPSFKYITEHDLEKYTLIAE